jgi:phosphoglycolate phosphatase-like HAD superfamily hydrolase
MISACVFDLDGTLINSAHEKTTAWYHVLEEYGVERNAVRCLLDTTQHGDRFDIAAKAATEFSLNHNAAAEIVMKYDATSTHIQMNCPELEAATTTLQELYETYSLFLLSATPQTRLHEIIEYRGWTKFFKAIIGRPTRKPEGLTIIAKTNGYKPHEIIMIGDSVEDKDAATSIGCWFLRVFPQNYHPLRNLSANIQQINKGNSE